ncbi:MAG: threonine aldolase family protein [Candidatus Asgardarchaeia archaeon]
MNKIIDLRSDTVTLPTEEMLQSILNAKLGDDVYQEDETVNELQSLVAKIMGKEDALLVTSGTQGNLVSLMAQTNHGDEVILEQEAHIYYYEVGGLSAVAGLVPRLIKGVRGYIPPEELEKALRPKNIHYPPKTLLCIENTHNRAGGTVITSKQMKDLADVAWSHDLKIHLDGARIFNAAVALDKDVKEFTKHVDSVMFCLSKGLAAPIGSLVVGSSEFIEKARKIRKMLGGGMRQAGIIAAPGSVALKTMIPRLKEDHENAKILVHTLVKHEEFKIDLETVQTNIIFSHFIGKNMNAYQLAKELQKYGVKIGAYSKTLVRFVTHYGITYDDIKFVIEVIDKILSGD